MTTEPHDRLEAFEGRLAAVTAELEQLKGLEAIRTCVLRFCRGLDRLDRGLMASSFHADATVDYGAIFQGAIAPFLDVTLKNQSVQREVQHLVGNILVNIDGERATVESYELARHKTPLNGEVRDLILAMRTLDQFERRAGQWRIKHRKKVMDWARIMSGTDPVYANSPIDKGTRDTEDPSYRLLNWGSG